MTGREIYEARIHRCEGMREAFQDTLELVPIYPRKTCKIFRIASFQHNYPPGSSAKQEAARGKRKQKQEASKASCSHNSNNNINADAPSPSPRRCFNTPSSIGSPLLALETEAKISLPRNPPSVQARFPRRASQWAGAPRRTTPEPARTASLRVLRRAPGRRRQRSRRRSVVARQNLRDRQSRRPNLKTW